MLARRYDRWLGILAVLALCVAPLGCGCTDDALPNCNPPGGAATAATAQLGGQLPGAPAAPGPGPIKPGQSLGPIALDVMFVLDDQVQLPEPGADVLAAQGFQHVADHLVWQLTSEWGLGVPEDYDVAYGLSRSAGSLEGEAWPYPVVQPLLGPGGEEWDGVWPETVYRELPALLGDAGWREGSLRLVVLFGEGAPEDVFELVDADDVVAMDPFAEDSAAVALTDLADAVALWQAAPGGRVPALTSDQILGYVYYECTFGIVNALPPELVFDPQALPIIPLSDSEGFYVSQSADGLSQIVRVPVYADDLPPDEVPEPLPVQWQSGAQRADPASTNEIRATVVFTTTYRVMEQAPGGGDNPTVDLGEGAVLVPVLVSGGTIEYLLPEVTDPAAPPTNTSTLTSVNDLGIPVLFVDVNRAILGHPYDLSGPWTSDDVPVPQEFGAPTITSVSPATGAILGGDTVTITGSNFYAAPVTVTFDGVPATDVSVQLNGKLTCVTPAHASGQVTVTVTTAEGSADLVAGFEYES